VTGFTIWEELSMKEIHAIITFINTFKLIEILQNDYQGGLGAV